MMSAHENTLAGRRMQFVDAHDYHEEQIELSAAATLALRTFIEEQKLSADTLLEGAWALLLDRYEKWNPSSKRFNPVTSGRIAELG